MWKFLTFLLDSEKWETQSWVTRKVSSGPQDNRKHLETLPPVTHATGHTQVTLHTSNTEVCLCGYTILCFGLQRCSLLHTSCFAVVYFSIHPPVVAVNKACWANRKTHVHAYKRIFRPLPWKTDMQEASFELPLQTWALFLPLSFLFFLPLFHLFGPPYLVGKTSMKFLWARRV